MNQKLVIGIDVSKEDFHVCAKVRTDSDLVKIKGTRSFKNTVKGFDEFYNWSYKRMNSTLELSFIMEATGGYYENLAYYLHNQGAYVIVVLPNKVKNFARSLNLKTKTDKSDSKMLAQFGIERSFEEWTPFSKHIKELRDLCRELSSLKRDLMRSKNQLHSLLYSYQKAKKIIQLKERQIVYLKSSIEELRLMIKDLVHRDPELEERIGNIVSIPGIGFESAVIMVVETNGFKLFENTRQLVSYVGLEVVFNESGSFKGKTRISKKGNKQIRQTLFMPAMSAIRSNEKIKKFHERICERNPQTKRKGIVASMRKLLILGYTLWKKRENYQLNYVWNHNSEDNDTKPSFSLLVG